MPASAAAIPFGVTLQAAFASSLSRVNGESPTPSAAPKTQSAASTSSRPAIKPDQAQLPSVGNKTVTAPVPPAAPSAISSQAALAISSDRVNAYGRTATAGPVTHSAAGTASRPVSNPDQAQPLPSDSVTTTVPVPPADQVNAQTKNSLAGQDSARTSDVSSKSRRRKHQTFASQSIRPIRPRRSPQLSQAPAHRIRLRCCRNR